MGEADAEAVRRLVHDLRSPLAVVDAFAALIARDGVDDQQRVEYARTIAEAVAEMRVLLDEAPGR